MGLEHHYAVTVDWTGNRGSGTSDYRAYGRDHLVAVAGKPTIEGSSDRAFRGDIERWNPEDMLVAALAQCHMLSYLYAAVTHGVVVTAYRDDAVGIMVQTSDGGGHFASVTLKPMVTVKRGTDVELAQTLHVEASRMCFIAASVNFDVLHEPTVVAD